MKKLIYSLAFLSALSSFGSGGSLRVYPGYLTKVRCEGRLLISAIGNDKLIRLEAFPSQLGCGVLLKPFSTTGRTNMVLETTTGSIEQIVEISSDRLKPVSADLDLSLKAGAK